jgi:AraC family L-rhamnose operon transcriptional activator RhaR
VEVLWIARYDYQADWELPGHRHKHFQVICFLSGSGSIRIADSRYDIAPGSVFLIKPGALHDLRPASLVKTLDVKFTVNDQLLLCYLLGAGEKVQETESIVSNLLERIRREGEAGNGFYREMCDLHLTEILIHFLRLDAGQRGVLRGPDSIDNIGEDTPADIVTQRVLNFIRDHYPEDLDVRGIAKAIGKSDRYIRRHFDESLGVSPMRYLLHYRIRKSKELIRHSDHELKEVAELVGFKTVHHFARAFHKICGETPGAWRNKYRSGICKDVCIHPNFSNKIRTITRTAAAGS